MKQSFIEGAVYGLLSAATAYFIVRYAGFNPQTLSAILYLNIITAILINMKAEVEELSISFLKNLVVVAEGEEMKLKRILTGEEYRVKGEVEKL